MKFFKKIFSFWSKKKVEPIKPTTEEHNRNVSAEVGLLVISELTSNRQFRRTLSIKFPELSSNIDFSVSKIKQ